MEEKKKSVFEILNAIDCSEHIEKKNGLSYLSWAWAWSICKKYFPDAVYTIYETPEGIPYWTDGRTCWVKTGVTIQGQEYIEYLPVMDYNNRSIYLDKLTSMDMNKAVQRSLTKALARHGLGLYIYAGEDLPEAKAEEKNSEAAQEFEQRRQEVLENIPNIQTLEESTSYWNWIKANFKEGTPQYNELRNALAARNREIKAAQEAEQKKAATKKAAKKKEPELDMPADGLESFNFDQIK